MKKFKLKGDEDEEDEEGGAMELDHNRQLELGERIKRIRIGKCQGGMVRGAVASMRDRADWA